MFLTTHISVAAAIGLSTGNPIAAALAGLVSHHLLDRTPHIDSGSSYVGGVEPESLSDLTWWEKLLAIIDVVVAFLLFFWLLSKFANTTMDLYFTDLWTTKDTIILWSFIGSIFPDVFYNLSKLIRPKFSYLFDGVPFKYYHRFHEWFHQTVSWKWWHVGLATQVVLIGGSLWWILK